MSIASVRAEPPLAMPVEGAPFRAELTAVAANWQLTFTADKKPRTIGAADLVRWGQCPEQGRGGTLVLADGGLLAADVVAADQQRLTADCEPLGTLKIPLEALAGVVFRPPSDPQRRDALLDRLAQATGESFSPLPSRDGQGVRATGHPVSPLPSGEGQGVRAAADSDRLLLLNGDELTGLFSGIADDAVRLQTELGPINVKTDRIAALIFNPALRRKPAAKADELRAWLGLSDGSRLLATRLLIERDRMTITTAGQTWKTSPKNLVFLQPLGGRAVYLSDLKPAEYRQTPFLDFPWGKRGQSPFVRSTLRAVPAGTDQRLVGDCPLFPLGWPYRADHNVTGGRLRAGGRLYLKGLGVHSAARLVYELGAGARGEGRGAGDKLLSPLPTNLRSVPGEGQPKNSPLPLGEGQGVRAGQPNSPLPLGEGQGVRATGPKALGSPSPGRRPGEPGDPKRPLGPTAQRFAAELAIDDSTAGGGSVQFRVLVDGREKFASPILRGGDPPVPVSVDLTGAKKLELLVDYADRADVLDHADWLDARLLK